MTNEQPVEIDVTITQWHGTTVVGLSGELDVHSLWTLRERLLTLDLDGGIALQTDLSELSFLDSTGIGTIVALAKRVRAAGGTFSTACPPGAVRQILETTGLVEYLQLDSVPDIEAAAPA